MSISHPYKLPKEPKEVLLPFIIYFHRARRAFCWEEEELLPYLATLSVLFMSSEIKVHTLMVV